MLLDHTCSIISLQGSMYILLVRGTMHRVKSYFIEKGYDFCHADDLKVTMENQ